MHITRVSNGSTRVNRDRPTVGFAAVTAMTIALILVPFMAGAAEPIGLGAANSYAVLAGTTITNTGATTINGDVGLHDGTDTPGFDQVTLTGDLQVATDEALSEERAHLRVPRRGGTDTRRHDWFGTGWIHALWRGVRVQQRSIRDHRVRDPRRPG